MSKGSSDPMQGLVANGRVEDVPDEGMQNYADDPAPGDGGGIGNKVVDNTAKLGNTFLDGLKSLGAMFAGPAAAAATAASKVTGAVGRTLNIGQGASKVVSLALVAAIAGTGAVGVASVLGNDDITTVYVGTVDCKKQVEEAKAKYGYGERDIPEEINGKPVGRTAVWENSMWWMQGGTGAGNRGTEDRRIVQDAAVESHGGDYDYYHEKTGIYTLAGDTDEYFLVAVAPAGFGRSETEPACVGDWITFYFEDGEAIETIVVDTKGNADDFADGDLEKEVGGVDGYGNSYTVNGYGHVQENGTNCFEFTSGGGKYNLTDGWPNDTMASLGGKLGDFESFGHKGGRICSFTNHGLAPELEGVMGSAYTGMLGMASSNQSSARAKGLDNAADECRKYCPSNYDNSTAALAALSLAYTQDVEFDGSRYPGTARFQEVAEKVLPDSRVASNRSCDHVVCTAVRWSGTDDDYLVANTDAQTAYMVASDKWEEHPYERSMIDSEGNAEGKLEPGDIWCEPGHTSMYVSGKLIKEFEFDAEQSEPGEVRPGSFSVSGSIGSYSDPGGIGSRAPGVGMDDGPAGAARVFRCVAPTGTSESKWAKDSDFDTPSVAATTGCNDKKKGKKKDHSTTDFSDMLIIGDSIIAASGEKGELERLLPGVEVDALSSRAWTDADSGGYGPAPGALDVAKSKGAGKYRIVFEIGTNGSLTHDQIKQLVRACPDDADIWFVTVYLDGLVVHTDKTNETIRWAASTFENVSVIDWGGHVKQHTELLSSDGIHLVDSNAGKVMAEYLAGALGAEGVRTAG